MDISGVSLEHARPPLKSLGVGYVCMGKDDGRGWVYDRGRYEM